ncbi:MAG: rRNA maturation RNase YbeY, partial [Xenococcaceae cyanobacterium]
TDDREIQALNARYRERDRPTDVLAFACLEVDVPQPAEELFKNEPLYLGDIIISVETARSQAKERGHELNYELTWLAAHGLLHLLGWDHPDEESLSEMLEIQEILLSSIAFKIIKFS